MCSYRVPPRLGSAARRPRSPLSACGGKATMAIDERSRHLLFQRLETILGADEATTLMEHLPPVGWADVATRHDLDLLRESVDRQFGELEERMTLRIESSENRVLGVIYQQIATVHDQIAG